jgi:hypothetical protein
LASVPPSLENREFFFTLAPTCNLASAFAYLEIGPDKEAMSLPD